MRKIQHQNLNRRNKKLSTNIKMKYKGLSKNCYQNPQSPPTTCSPRKDRTRAKIQPQSVPTICPPRKD